MVRQKRRSRNKKGMGSLLQNRKTQALFFFVIMAVGLWAALGGFASQSAYSERTLDTYVGFMLQTEDGTSGSYQKEWLWVEVEGIEFPENYVDKSHTIDFIRIYAFGSSNEDYNVRVTIESLSRTDYSVVATLVDLSPSGVGVSTSFGAATSYTTLSFRIFNFDDYIDTLFRVTISMDDNTDSVGAEVYTLIVSTDGLPPSDVPEISQIPTITGPLDGAEIEYASNVGIVWTFTGTLYDIEIKTDGILEWSDVEAIDGYLLPATEFIPNGVVGESYVIEFSGLTVVGDVNSRIFYTATWNIYDPQAPTDTTAPVITSVPTNLTYIEGAVGNVLEWVGTEENKASYIYIIDGVETHYPWTTQGTLSEPFIIDVDGLLIGTYSVGIRLIDASGNMAESFVFVTVINAAPILTSPEDVSFKVSDTIPTIVWDVSESVTATVVIDGPVTDTRYPLYIGGQVSVYCNNIVVGEYDYTITVEDGNGDTATDVVHVIVNADDVPGDVTTPLLSSPASIDGLGSAVGIIDWDVTDDSSGTYEITRNGDVVESGTWDGGDTITYSYTETGAGVYYYRIVVTDSAGNAASDTVTISLLGDESDDPDPIPDYDIEGFLEEYWMYIAIGVGILIIIPVLSGRRESY